MPEPTKRIVVDLEHFNLAGQYIRIELPEGPAFITIEEIHEGRNGGKAKIGIDAEPCVPIWRLELLREIQEEAKEGNKKGPNSRSHSNHNGLTSTTSTERSAGNRVQDPRSITNQMGFDESEIKLPPLSAFLHRRKSSSD